MSKDRLIDEEFNRINLLTEEELDQELEQLGINFEASRDKILKFSKSILDSNKVENIEDHLALSCIECGSVKWALLKSGQLECHNCGYKVDKSG